MAFTPKQIRNGADQGGGGHMSAVPSADLTGDISGLVDQAMSVGLGFGPNGEEGHTFMSTAQGAGPMDMGSGGAMWDWDAGLAIAEPPGEAG